MHDVILRHALRQLEDDMASSLETFEAQARRVLGHGVGQGVAALYLAVTVLLAATVLREPFRLSQGLGLLVCGVSVGLVAMG